MRLSLQRASVGAGVQAMSGEPKSGWVKLGAAAYYCFASMTVQFMNKVRALRHAQEMRPCALSEDGFAVAAGLALPPAVALSLMLQA